MIENQYYKVLNIPENSTVDIPLFGDWNWATPTLLPTTHYNGLYSLEDLQQILSENYDVLKNAKLESWSLPPGLIFSRTDNRIEGRPIGRGTYDVRISCIRKNVKSYDIFKFNIICDPLAPVITGPSFHNIRYNKVYGDLRYTTDKPYAKITIDPPLPIGMEIAYIDSTHFKIIGQPDTNLKYGTYLTTHDIRAYTATGINCGFELKIQTSRGSSTDPSYISGSIDSDLTMLNGVFFKSLNYNTSTIKLKFDNSNQLYYFDPQPFSEYTVDQKPDTIDPSIFKLDINYIGQGFGYDTDLSFTVRHVSKDSNDYIVNLHRISLLTEMDNNGIGSGQQLIVPSYQVDGYDKTNVVGGLYAPPWPTTIEQPSMSVYLITGSSVTVMLFEDFHALDPDINRKKINFIDVEKTVRPNYIKPIEFENITPAGEARYSGEHICKCDYIFSHYYMWCFGHRKLNGLAFFNIPETPKYVENSIGYTPYESPTLYGKIDSGTRYTQSISPMMPGKHIIQFGDGKGYPISLDFQSDNFPINKSHYHSGLNGTSSHDTSSLSIVVSGSHFETKLPISNYTSSEVVKSFDYFTTSSNTYSYTYGKYSISSDTLIGTGSRSNNIGRLNIYNSRNKVSSTGSWLRHPDYIHILDRYCLDGVIVKLSSGSYNNYHCHHVLTLLPTTKINLIEVGNRKINNYSGSNKYLTDIQYNKKPNVWEPLNPPPSASKYYYDQFDATEPIKHQAWVTQSIDRDIAYGSKWSKTSNAPTYAIPYYDGVPIGLSPCENGSDIFYFNNAGITGDTIDIKINHMETNTDSSMISVDYPLTGSTSIYRIPFRGYFHNGWGAIREIDGQKINYMWGTWYGEFPQYARFLYGSEFFPWPGSNMSPYMETWVNLKYQNAKVYKNGNVILNNVDQFNYANGPDSIGGRLVYLDGGSFNDFISTSESDWMDYILELTVTNQNRMENWVVPNSRDTYNLSTKTIDLVSHTPLQADIDSGWSYVNNMDVTMSSTIGNYLKLNAINH